MFIHRALNTQYPNFVAQTLKAFTKGIHEHVRVVMDLGRVAVRIEPIARRRRADTEGRMRAHISCPEQLAVYRRRKPRCCDISSHVPDEDPHNRRVLGSPIQIAQPGEVCFAPPVGRGRQEWRASNIHPPPSYSIVLYYHSVVLYIPSLPTKIYQLPNIFE